ncbi:hypothetical protein HJG53_03595 [Sphingomonas sp. ID1715]|uniref:hypothetical protein n=1 Tax=Sphingomonas sp. ID1715 TaxID=1656898 RepID=UPI0014898E85|nr:hypothetical protein [Sphingomonas sp. ID1715]NNM75991.1 hypothetical protein [Sphingomonas sp. ID1715]
MNMLARIGALLVALFGLALGLWFFFATDHAAAAFFVTPQGAAGLATLRADMSAFFLVSGLCALYAAIAERGEWLIVSAGLYGIALTGRAANLIVAGSYDGAAIPMIVEALLVALSLFGWRQLRRS